ncbi:MAG: MGMT family protein [Phycisphaerae bacterium]|nr:MGMT family protein [Phycisphaerae bacterium]
MSNSRHEKAIKSGRLLPQMSFSEKVWALTARVPPGRVTTYAEIARRLGGRAYRATGMALNRNPYAPKVPCHRVVGSDGHLVGFATGLAKKRRMLAAEGVPIRAGRVDLPRSFHAL